MRTPFSVLFDGSFEGFLCVIHAFYYDKIQPVYIQREDGYQQTLDTEPYYVASHKGKAAQVTDGYRRKAGAESAHILCTAFMAGDSDIYMDLFRYALLGFTVGAAVDDHLREDYVARAHHLSRRVTHEAHMWSGFCRFAETKQGVYYAAVTPKHNVLPLLAEHFRGRFMNHAWVIYDKKHCMAAVYDGEDYMIENVPVPAQVAYADDETQIQALWTVFFNTIAIKERRNQKIQRQNAALYFRGDMVEHNLNPAKADQT